LDNGFKQREEMVMRHAMPAGKLSVFVGLALATVLSSGCGEAAPPKAQVKGKVTLNGDPVKGGKITFAPLTGSGYMATGEVKEDGTFVLKTESGGDGAPIGKGRVAYSPPAIQWEGTPEGWDSSKGDPPKPKTPYDGMSPKQSEIEIKAGDNDLAIELGPGA
jgi:hypothetical protein